MYNVFSLIKIFRGPQNNLGTLELSSSDFNMKQKKSFYLNRKNLILGFQDYFGVPEKKFFLEM